VLCVFPDGATHAHVLYRRIGGQSAYSAAVWRVHSQLYRRHSLSSYGLFWRFFCEFCCNYESSRIILIQWATFLLSLAFLLFVVSAVARGKESALFGVFGPLFRFFLQIPQQLKNFFRKSNRAHHRRTRRGHLCAKYRRS